MQCLCFCSNFDPLCLGHAYSSNLSLPRRRSHESSLLSPKPLSLITHHLFKKTHRKPSHDATLTFRASSSSQESTEKEDEFSILTAMRSPFNDIVMIQSQGSRILLLDSTRNIHSIYTEGQKLTGSYWDEFACLPEVVPKGPIAILGLGGGTAAHLMLDLWPSLELEGWEIDEILIDKARKHFYLSDLEKCNEAGGILHVHVGDALSPMAVVPGGFSGIIVDLFSDGKVLPQLQEVSTWLELEKRLMPNGRIMVNCGGAHAEACSSEDENYSIYFSCSEGVSLYNPTITALCTSFPGNLSWRKMEEGESLNYLALTGPPPDLSAWSAAVPSQLSSNIKNGNLFNFHDTSFYHLFTLPLPITFLSFFMILQNNGIQFFGCFMKHLHSLFFVNRIGFPT